MSKQRRRIARDGSYLVDLVLFRSLSAPNEEALAERRRLIAAFRVLMADVKESNPRKLWDYLVKAHAKWDQSEQSKLMELVADVLALREIEAEVALADGGETKAPGRFRGRRG